MSAICKIDTILTAQPTMDGAGVKLRRVFGFYEKGLMDPFLLLDYFGSDNPADFIAGFPWHPHRGIETVTYILEGTAEHGDSMGNSGVIHSGDIQWMTAGSGIIHQEMPKSTGGPMYGFQLWVNLPASQKMMPPRYQDIRAEEIPSVKPGEGIIVKVVAGEFMNVKGPVKDIVADPEYFDISVLPGNHFHFDVKQGHTVFAFVFKGEGNFDEHGSKPVKEGQLAKFSDGDRITITTGSKEVRFLLVSGKPLHEPIAWGGPVVMNTDEEVTLAFKEYRAGTFIKGHEG